MACELCGGGDPWIKTCITPEGSRLLVCDSCYGECEAALTIVPGNRVVTARCASCGIYGNPRGFLGLRLGGRKGAYSGTCWMCAGRAVEWGERGPEGVGEVSGDSTTSPASTAKYRPRRPHPRRGRTRGR